MPFSDSEIQIVAATGTGSMGSVTAASDNWKARLQAVNYPFVLAALNVTFSAGTGSATLSLKRDAGDGTAYDRTVQTWALVGGGGSGIYHRTKDEDVALYTFRRSVYAGGVDVPVLEWTDPGTSTWLVEWGIARAR